MFPFYKYIFIGWIFVKNRIIWKFQSFEILKERVTRKMIVWAGWLYSLGSKFIAWGIGHMCKKSSCQKTCLIAHKSSFQHFLHLCSYTKILMHNYVPIWNIITTTWIILSWTIQNFSIKYVTCKNYAQKIVGFFHETWRFLEGSEITRTGSSFIGIFQSTLPRVDGSLMGFSYQYPEMQVLKIIYFHFSNIRSQPASQPASGY